MALATWVLFVRALREIPRVPTRIAFPLIGPVMQVILLTSAFASLSRFNVYGSGSSSVQFMTGGILSLTVLAGAGGAGFQMVQDIDSGFLDKLRVAPISRSSIVLALLLTDAVRLALQALLVLVIALALGAHVEAGVPGVLAMLLLAALFGAAWSGISLNVALRTRNPEVTAAANALTFPLYFGSTAFMPPERLPGWLQTVVRLNPVDYLIRALRSLMVDGFSPRPLLGAVAAALVVGAITLPLAVRAFQRTLSQ